MNVNRLTQCPRCGEMSLEHLSAHGFCPNCNYYFSSENEPNRDPFIGQAILGTHDDDTNEDSFDLEYFGISDGDPEELDFRELERRGYESAY
jgi:hypothetical protein